MADLDAIYSFLWTAHGDGFAAVDQSLRPRDRVYEEHDGRASRELMRIARMQRAREQLVQQWGEQCYEIVLALYHWMIYLLLAKLSAAYYVLERGAI